jgi:glucose-6-phosphate isomerase
VHQMKPIHSLQDLTTGKIAEPAEYTARRISDLIDFFHDRFSIEEARRQDDRIVYEVNEFTVPEANGQLLFGTTIIHPGKDGDDYFMTKGHFNFKEDVAEVFVCLGGDG